MDDGNLDSDIKNDDNNSDGLRNAIIIGMAVINIMLLLYFINDVTEADSGDHNAKALAWRANYHDRIQAIEEENGVRAIMVKSADGFIYIVVSNIGDESEIRNPAMKAISDLNPPCLITGTYKEFDDVINNPDK